MGLKEAPADADFQVFLALQSLWLEQGRPELLQFTGYAALKRLGWVRSGKAYARLRLSLWRWSRTHVATEALIADADGAEWQEETAGGVLEYRWRTRRKSAQNEPEPSAHQISVRFSQFFQDALTHEALSGEDLKALIALPFGSARYLARFLKHRFRDGKRQYEQDVVALCRHLGLDYAYPSQAARVLGPAIRALQKAGLFAVEIVPAQSGGLKLRARSIPRPSPEPTPVRPAPAPAPRPSPRSVPTKRPASVPEPPASPEENARELAAVLAEEDNPTLALYRSRRQERASITVTDQREERVAGRANSLVTSPYSQSA